MSLFGQPRSDRLFSLLDTSIIESHFGTGMAPFSDADPVGEFISRIFPYLSIFQKEAAFSRLVKIAVSYHRFSVMADVRSVYEHEKYTNVLDILDRIVIAEDPSATIHGRGKIFRVLQI